MDGQEVESYATMALRWWSAPLNRHGRTCPCLPCADCRVYFGLPALKPEPVNQRGVSAA